MPSSIKASYARDLAFVKKLVQDYPQFRFRFNSKRFSYRNSTIFIGPPQPFFALQTLHELGHALCHHKDYTTSVSRLKIECEAWERAKTAYLELPDHLKTFPWDEEYIEDSLDTYRAWLHTKSTCKNCGLTCYQTEDGVYHCPRCENFT